MIKNLNTPKNLTLKLIILSTLILIISVTKLSCQTISADKLKVEFLIPPDAARPGVYWYFMDGNMSKEAMNNDL